MNRRKFVQILSASPFMYPIIIEYVKPCPPIGLQLWSVRDDMKKDTVGTLKKVKKMGYKYVEGGASYSEGKFYNFAPHAFKNLLSDIGLEMPIGHNMLSLKDDGKNMSDAFKLAVDCAKEIGQNIMINPWVFDEERSEGLRLAEMMNRAGEYLQKYDMQLGYHNHVYEFKKYQTEKILLQELLDNTDPVFVHFQLDVYWAELAGYPATNLLQRYPTRFKWLHIKDMANTEKRETIEVGLGTLPIQQIFDVAQ